MKTPSPIVELLGWDGDDLADPDPEHHRLPELDVTLEPHWQVKDREGSPQLLIRCELKGSALGTPSEIKSDWRARSSRLREQLPAESADTFRSSARG